MRYTPQYRSPIVLSSVFAAFALGGTTAYAADDATPFSLEQMAKRLQDLEKKNASLETEVSRLRQDDNETWLSEARANEIRAVVQDTLADASSRASLQSTGATAGWDNGFFLQSGDGRFRLEIGGLIQVRYVYSNFREPSPAVGISGINALWSDGRDTRKGFDLPGTELWFKGHVFGSGLTYKILGRFENNNSTQLAVNNVRPIEVGSGGFSLWDAWVRVELTPNLFVRTGQFKLPFGREQLIDRQNQMAVERSIVSQSLDVGYSQGVELAYVDELMRAQFAMSDGGEDQVAGQLKTAGTLPRNRPFSWGQVEWAGTGRFEFKPYGEWKDFDAFTSVPGSDFGLMFGIGAHWQSWRPDYAYQPIGVNQGDNQWLNMTVDASANFGGASLFGSFTWSYADSEAAYYYAGQNNFNLPVFGDMGSSNKWGAVVQGAFYVAPKFEIFGRYEVGQFSVSNPNTLPIAGGAGSLYANENHLSVATVGANWYIDGQDVKLSCDVGYAFRSFDPSWFQGNDGWRVSGSSDQLVARAQFQLGF
ncbi:MAG: porin [Phycisphaerae bacterium]|nr:porin [Phycisphaerae bacterium]